MALPSDIAAVSSENCDPARQKGNKKSVSIQPDKGTHRCTCRSRKNLSRKRAESTNKRLIKISEEKANAYNV